MDNTEQLVKGFIESILKIQAKNRIKTAEVLYAITDFQIWLESHGFMKKDEFNKIFAKVIKESDFM